MFEEMLFLSKSFKSIVILNTEDLSKRGFNRNNITLPPNVKMMFIQKKEGNYKKTILFLKMITKKYILNEIKYVLISKHLILNKLRALFEFFIKSIAIFNEIKTIYKPLSGIEDYFYSYWVDGYLLSSIELKKLNPSIKIISRAHGWDIYEERTPINYLPLRNYLLSNVTACFFISEHGKNYTKNRYSRIDNSILRVSRLGVNKTKYKPLKDKETLLIVSLSVVCKIKRIELIIKGLSCINDINIKWNHIGYGEDLNKMNDLAKKLLMSKENISFKFEGLMEHEDVINYFKNQNIDLLINTSEFEGIPVSIMEAMSFGIPCIATAVGGTPEIVNYDNGFLLSPNPTSQEVANEIMAYNNLSKKEKNKKREAAYKTWLERYNSERNYQKFIDNIFCL